MADQQTVILVVEDDEAVRTLLRAALGENDNWTVTAVANGAEALAFLDSVRPHLIVLDVTMPGIDGLTVYKHIRAREALSTVPVLFLSAMSSQRAASLEGPFTWMSKPFDINDLETTIEDLLGKGAP